MSIFLTIKNIDPELLSQQKNDLIDVIGFLEASLKDHPAFLKQAKWMVITRGPHTKAWIASLDGLLNMIDDMQDSGVGKKH